MLLRSLSLSLAVLAASTSARSQDVGQPKPVPKPDAESKQPDSDESSKPQPAPTTRPEEERSKSESDEPTIPTLLVLVHAENSMTGVTSSELQSYFKKQRRFWPNGTRTMLCLRPSSSTEMEILLDEVYGWTAKQLRRHWKSKSFRGEITGGKAFTVAPTAENAIARVQADPSIVTIVLATDLPADTEGVRVLEIDGKRSTDADYPLRGKPAPKPQPERPTEPREKTAS